jgi:hypothetical protein
MFICGMRNNVRMAVESIAGNTNMLETALMAVVHYESALNIGGGQKQGGAHRYGQLAALQVKGDENAAAQASSSSSAAGMQDMKAELAAITSALASIGVKKGGKGKPPGGAPPRGRESRRWAARQAGQAQDAQQLMQWAHSTPGTGSSAIIAANEGSTLPQSAQGRKQSATNSHPVQNCRCPVQRGTICLTQT